MPAVSPVDIPFPDLHPRTGTRVHSVEGGPNQIRPDERFGTAPYAALLFWPRDAGDWFDVEAEAVSERGSKKFGSRVEDLYATLRERRADHSALAQRVAADQWTDRNRFLIATLSATETVRLHIRVETNRQSFVKFVQNPPPDGVVVELKAAYFDGGVDQADRQTLRVILTPVTPVPASGVFLALDIGNTSTTAAIYKPLSKPAGDAAPLSRSIPMLTTGPVAGARGIIGAASTRGHPIPSELRIDAIRTLVPPGTGPLNSRRFPDTARFPGDQDIDAVDYVLGELSRTAGVPAQSIVLGAKRMAAARPLRRPDGTEVYPTSRVVATHRLVPDPPDSGGETRQVPNAPIDLDVRAPLELLAARLFQYFREAQLAWPRKIALTYPTTYSRYELQSLRRAVQRGWLRMQAIGQLPGCVMPDDPELVNLGRELQAVVNGEQDLATQSRDPLVQLLIDEASAAAFFHLRKKIFEDIDGGLAVFRYLYEHGLNMLLYDCGGGTTDIALVNASVEVAAPAVAGQQPTWWLKMAVLRRSGVRTFGGDDVTRQVCRLVKAKVAYAIANIRGRAVPAVPPPVAARRPAHPGAWEDLARNLNKFIDAVEQADPGDVLVPTRTLSGQPQTEARRAAALDLWQMGEKLKCALSTPVGPAGALPADVRLQLPTDREVSALLKATSPGDTAQWVQIRQVLQGVVVSRSEIDALIFEPVMRSIENCNTLIHDVLDRPDAEGRPREVHWVVASGNAVRYPFLQQMLREYLAVASLDDGAPDRPGRFTFDPENAKDATAKGAVLALAAMEAGGNQLNLKFESNLYNLLPYNVGYWSAIIGDNQVLFREHTHYDDLKETKRNPEKIPLAALGQGQLATRQFVLRRQFPGDPGYHDFLAFEFPDGIKGRQLEVWYDDKDPFEFRVKAGSEEGRPVDLMAGDIYTAPALRGDI